MDNYGYFHSTEVPSGLSEHIFPNPPWRRECLSTEGVTYPPEFNKAEESYFRPTLGLMGNEPIVSSGPLKIPPLLDTHPPSGTLREKPRDLSQSEREHVETAS